MKKLALIDMAPDNITFERSLSLGEKAFEKIIHYRVVATPPNYDVWYNWASGQNSDLITAVARLLETAGTVTDRDLEELYTRYVSPIRHSDQIVDIGAKLTDEAAELVSSVSANTHRAEKYGGVLGHSIERLSGGVSDRSQLLQISNELASATRESAIANDALLARLRAAQNEIAELQSKLALIREETLTDALTTLANRKAFDQGLDRSLAGARSKSEGFSLLLADIDNFKLFNDTYGHLTGDQVLRLVAQSIKSNVKGGDLAARYGGEEFAVILPATALKQAQIVGEHLRLSVMSKELVKRSTGATLGKITISVGVATYRPGDTSATLIERADECLYSAKRNGRNRVVSERELGPVTRVTVL